jgi:hypothetical protein
MCSAYCMNADKIFSLQVGICQFKCFYFSPFSIGFVCLRNCAVKRRTLEKHLAYEFHFFSFLFDFMSILWFGLLFNTVINPNCHKDKILLWVVKPGFKTDNHKEANYDNNKDLEFGSIPFT